MRDPAPAAESLAGRIHRDARLSARERVLIYRRAYWARQIEALQDQFRRLARRIGQRAFADLMHEYLLAHPSSDPRIENIGRQLSPFLRQHPRERCRGFADLAAFEWAEVEVLLAGDPPRIVTGLDVPAAAFPACGLTMVPALRILALSTDPLPEPAGVPGPTVFAVWRQGFFVRHRRLEPDEHSAAVTALARESISTVCEAFRDSADPALRASAVLSNWMASGWIADIGRPVEDAAR
jgi:hypothetical protein